MAERIDIEVSWEDAASGKLAIPRDAPVRVVVKRCPVHIVDIPTVDPSFHPKSAVMLPEGVLPALARALEFAAEQPDASLLLAGHPGIALAQSKALARNRGENVLRFLQGGDWAAHCQAHHHTVDWLHMLTWAAEVHGLDCSPGSAGNVPGPAAFEALARFRSATWAAGVPVPGEIRTEDWAACSELFRISLAKKLAIEPSELDARLKALGWVDPGCIGCGPEWHTTSSSLFGFAASGTQRVDLLFFPNTVHPLLGHEAIPGESIYGEPNFLAVPLSYVPDPKVRAPTEGPKPPPAKPKTGPTTPPPFTEPPPPEVEIELTYVDSVFAPGEESLVIGYGVGEAPPHAARVEILSDAYGSDPIFVHELSPAELSANSGLVFEWDGKTTCETGALVDSYINPLYTPYRARIIFDRGVGDESTAELPFDVLYDSIQLVRGPWTAEFDETGEEPEHVNAWCKLWLNELGYHAGVINNELDDDLKKAIIRYRHNHPDLWTLHYDDYKAEIDQPLLEALAAQEQRRDWLSTTPSAADARNLMGLPIGDAFADSTKETKVMVELLSHERQRDVDEFGGDKHSLTNERLSRPLIPVEVDVLLRTKSGAAVRAPKAVGPVRVNWRVEDVEEDVAGQVLDPSVYALGRNYIEKALETSGGHEGQGDNCPLICGGRRMPVMEWVLYLEEGEVYAPYTIERDVGNGTLFGTADLGTLSKRRGKAGIMLRPSTVAGDAYRVHAEIVFTGLSNRSELEARHSITSPSPLHVESGVFRVWRRAEIAYCVTWPSRGTSAAHQWDKLADEYQRAYVALDISNIEYKPIKDVITEEQYFDLVEEHTEYERAELELNRVQLGSDPRAPA